MHRRRTERRQAYGVKKRRKEDGQTRGTGEHSGFSGGKRISEKGKSKQTNQKKVKNMNGSIS